MQRECISIKTAATLQPVTYLAYSILAHPAMQPAAHRPILHINWKNHCEKGAKYNLAA